MEDLIKENQTYWNETHSLRQTEAHWLGAGHWNGEAWLKIGEDDLKRVVKYTKTKKEDWKSKTALEYGCGGGAKIRSLSRIFSRVIGVDISLPSLVECARQMKAYRITNFMTEIIPAAHPEILIDKYARCIDFILCTGVLYHLPSKEYVERVLRIFYGLLRPGSYAVVQFRYDDGTVKYRTRTSNYTKNAIFMTSFTKGEFVELAKRCGFACELKETINSINYQYALLRSTL